MSAVTPIVEADSTPRQSPAVSVIFNLSDHRGIALEAVESWTEKQRCDPAIFELIVVSDDTVRNLEPEVRRKLRAHDRLLHAGGNEISQYDLAARQAHGDILLFTEPHCLGEPEAVAEVIHYLETTSMDGCCARSTHIAPNRVGRGEMWMCKEAFVEWSQPDNWRKVIVRGFAIRRDAFLDVGGFDHHYDRFAEWLLAARLHAKGYHLGYAPGFGVSHVYCSSLTPLRQSIKEFTQGECLFRLEHDSQEFCERYFGAPPEWYEARSLDHTVARLLVDLLWRQIRKREGATSEALGRAACLKSLRRLLPTAALGERAPRLKRLLPVWSARVRFAFWRFHEERMLRAFRDWYMGLTALSRVEFALEHARRSRIVERAETSLVATMDQIEGRELFGFHAIEIHRGEPFRWSSAVAAIRIDLQPEDYDVTVQLNDARDVVPSKEITVFFNREPLAPIELDPDRRCLKFTVPRHAFRASGDQWLVVLCTPWTLADVHLRDPRPLGLPVVALSFEPVVGSR